MGWGGCRSSAQSVQHLGSLPCLVLPRPVSNSSVFRHLDFVADLACLCFLFLFILLDLLYQYYYLLIDSIHIKKQRKELMPHSLAASEKIQDCSGRDGRWLYRDGGRALVNVSDLQ